MNKHQRELLEEIRQERAMKEWDEMNRSEQEAARIPKLPEYPPVASEDKAAIAKEAPCYGTEIAQGLHEFAGTTCIVCGRNRGGFEKAEPRMTQFGE
jgi:hypothetical protein